jgi:hypothetical protein
MKKMALAAAIWLTASVQAEELQSSYLCVAEQATGFIFDAQSDRWKATRFNIENGRYILKLYSEPEPLPEGAAGHVYGEVRQVGLEIGKGFFTLCPDGFDENGRITCAAPALVQKFRMDANTLRYYLTVGGESLLSATLPDTAAGQQAASVAIEIGSCKRL